MTNQVSKVSAASTPVTKPAEKKFIEVNGQNGKIKVQKELWGKYTAIGVGDQVELKNGIKISVFERIKNEPPCDIKIEDWNGRTDFTIKDASVWVESKNNKKDHMYFIPSKDAMIDVEKDANDIVRYGFHNNIIKVH